MDTNDPPESIPYRNAKDDVPSQRRHVAALIGGVFVGVVLVAVTGVLVALGAAQLVSSKHHSPYGAVACYGVTAIVAGVLGVTLLRKSPRRFALAGLLLGAAVTALIEGTCFMTM